MSAAVRSMPQAREPAPDPEFDALVPADPLMVWAWHGSVDFTLSQPDAMAEFQNGTAATAPRTVYTFARLAHESTGRNRPFVLAFLRWHNDTVWGDVRTDHTGAVVTG